MRSTRRARAALVERLLELREGVALALLGLLLGVGLGAALAEALEPALDLRHVRQRELEVDDGDVRHRVHLAVDVDDVVVVEAPDGVDDGVALTDVREELVPQPRAVGGALDQTGDVDELARGRDDVRGAADGGEGLEAVVGDGDDPGVGLDGAEGVVGRLGRSVRRSALNSVLLPTTHGHEWNMRGRAGASIDGTGAERTRGATSAEAVLHERVEQGAADAGRPTMPVLSAMDVTGADAVPRARPGAAVHERTWGRPRTERCARGGSRTKRRTARDDAGVQDNGHGGRFARARSPRRPAAPIARRPDKS